MATINIIGDLVNDQTSGLQDDDILFTDLNADFQAYLATLPLSADQLAFAADVGGASQGGLVNVVLGAGEVLDSLLFTPGIVDAPTGLTAIDGGAITISTTAGGNAMLAKDASGDIVAAFWILPDGTVQMATFEAITNPDATNPDDRVDWGDFLKVRATTHVDDNIGDDVFSDDDGPSAGLSGNIPTLTVDETNLGQNDTKDFSVVFTHDFGTDGAGAGGGIGYQLGITGAATFLITSNNDTIDLVLLNGGTLIQGVGHNSGIVAFNIILDPNTGAITLDQIVAVKHADPNTQNEFVSLAGAISLTATVTDADGDHVAQAAPIGDHFQLFDDAPSVQLTGTDPTLTVDESNFAIDATGSIAANFLPTFGNDGAGLGGGVTYDLHINPGATGLVDEDTGENIVLVAVGATIEGRTALGGLTAFVVSVDALGNVTLNESRSVDHANPNDPNDVVTLPAGLITLTATVTDGDGDHATSAPLSLDHLNFVDDAPLITAPFNAGTDGRGTGNHEIIGNAVGQTATGAFGFDIGHDLNHYAFGESDFLSFNFTGTVDNPQNPGITSPVMTKTGETATSADFDFSFHYDKDPITAGIQDATAGGTLHIDKVGDTYQFAMTDPVDGFSFEVLHTANLLSKEPTSNTGHPLIVTERLTELNDPDPLFVQFTANTVKTGGGGFGFFTNTTGADNNTGNAAYVNGEFVANANPDWVSATQLTNGVAGDTIQKGELLTLRLFDTNVGIATEADNPTQSVDAIALKFDGIGNSEDLMMVLNLIDDKGTASTADDVETTKAIYIANADIFKTGQVPAPYSSAFTLDNNDGLVVVESNDYNAAGENFKIQGVQIMQSANGITGNAIDFNGATGVSGGSSGTVAWDPTDNDVLKIVDIGFISTTTGTIDANLAFNFNIADGDGDATGVQTINLNINNDFIV